MSRALSFLIKPASGSCNMRCEYCFYADEMSHREVALYGKMSEKTLEAMVKKAFEADTAAVTFGFQGGEPLLMGLDFYEEFCALKKFYNKKGIPVKCTVQTNGTLINKNWADFFSRENFLVGLSLDGPRSINDSCRKDAEKEGTFKQILKAADFLKESKTSFNILTVLTEKNAAEIERIYRFFISRNFMYQQYIPCLDSLENEGESSIYALTGETYGQALKTLFDLWYEDTLKGRKVYIRYFENLIGIYAGLAPESCDMAGKCCPQYVIEADGSVYPCDFYVLDKYRIGNIAQNSLEEIDRLRKESGFIEASETLPEKCASCPWRRICRGGCRRNRVFEENRKPIDNRLCEAYEIFLPYADERLKYLAGLVRPGFKNR